MRKVIQPLLLTKYGACQNNLAEKQRFRLFRITTAYALLVYIILLFQVINNLSSYNPVMFIMTALFIIVTINYFALPRFKRSKISYEVIGKNPAAFLYEPVTDITKAKNIQTNIANHTLLNTQLSLYSKHGKELIINIQLQPIYDEAGKLKQYFSVHTDITEKKQLEMRLLDERLLRQKEISEAVIVAQESERSEIGRELHDNITQLLGAARLYIQTAQKNEKDRESLLNSSSAYTLTAIEEIRKLSKTLITPSIKDIGLVDSTRDLIDTLNLVQEVKVDLVVKNFNEEELNEKFKLNIYRIVQEQLNNTIKHAQATTITISYIQTADKLLFEIADDGIGFDMTKPRKGIGLANIISRSELYKGNVILNSTPGNGCKLSISFLLENEYYLYTKQAS